MKILRKTELGIAILELCCEHGMSRHLHAKYHGINVSMISRMKELEAENHRLKKMYVEA